MMVMMEEMEEAFLLSSSSLFGLDDEVPSPLPILNSLYISSTIARIVMKLSRNWDSMPIGCSSIIILLREETLPISRFASTSSTLPHLSPNLVSIQIFTQTCQTLETLSSDTTWSANEKGIINYVWIHLCYLVKNIEKIANNINT